eukprot:GABV01013573.1.p2 GENE.GABV01013573.1~~GABV01013573.1.p2  ORF type:complete len:120 (-),score=31.02 GABV01013573.1:3-362(-)
MHRALCAESRNYASPESDDQVPAYLSAVSQDPQVNKFLAQLLGVSVNAFNPSSAAQMGPPTRTPPSRTPIPGMAPVGGLRLGPPAQSAAFFRPKPSPGGGGGGGGVLESSPNVSSALDA